MSTGRPLPRYTYAEYVAIERQSDIRHEFLDGEIYAMSGGTLEHAALAAQVISLLDQALGERDCRVYTSDLRIYVESAGLATFPDGSVICGDVELHPPSPEATALNPVVLLEVTSNSSEAYDTITKLDIYKTIPSLREYIIVSHRERRITVHRRDGDSWGSQVGINGGRVSVESLGAELAIDDVYRRSAIR